MPSPLGVLHHFDDDLHREVPALRELMRGFRFWILRELSELVERHA